MKKIFLTILIIFTGLLYFHSAFAVTKTSGDLTITYPSEPLFNEKNIAPGFSISKIVNVMSNNPSQEKKVGVEFVSTTGSSLDSMLLFSLERNGNNIFFQKTLQELKSAGIITLSTISPHHAYDFIITAYFPETAGNQFANQVTHFDFSVGFFQVDTPTTPNTNTHSPSEDTKPNILGSDTSNTNKSPKNSNKNTKPLFKGKILGLEITLPKTGLPAFTVVGIIIIGSVPLTNYIVNKSRVRRGKKTNK
jgi:hypothetical protein